jgi:hypothetical protein
VTTETLAGRLAERTEELRRLLDDTTDVLIALHWQQVAADVRQFVPEATGLRLLGTQTEQGLRLNLDEVLVNGEPAVLDDERFAELENLLDQGDSLLAIAEREDEGVTFGLRDHDLPSPGVPGEGLLLTVPLLGEGELRCYAPNPEEGDPGGVFVLDVLGVAVLIRQRATGALAVHVDQKGASPRPVDAEVLLVEDYGGARRYRL